MFNISGKRLTKVYTVDGKEITGYDIFGNGDSAAPIKESEEEVFDLITEQNNSTLNITGGRDINLILQDGSNLLLM